MSTIFLLNGLGVLIFVFVPALSVHVGLCPDREKDSFDYGDLSKPGTGRRIFIKHGHFEVSGEKVFLSGATIPLISHGTDFRSSNYRKNQMGCLMRKIHHAGGNIIKVRLQDTQYQNLNTSGHVTNLNQSEFFISDVKKFFRAAAYYDMVAFVTIWDGWHGLNHLKSFVNDASVLQAYIDNVLVPLIKAIKDEPGFAGVEIINKMGDHILHGEANSQRCFDTAHSLGLSGPGKYSIENVWRFISWQADAMRRVDPDILITAGFHDNGLLSDRDGFDYMKDECLLKAGGRPNGYLSFYGMELEGSLVKGIPSTIAMKQLDRPLVLQLATKVENKTADDIFRWAYEESYSGILYSHLRTQHSDFFPLLLPEQLDAINELQQTAA